MNKKEIKVGDIVYFGYYLDEGKMKRFPVSVTRVDGSLIEIINHEGQPEIVHESMIVVPNEDIV